MRVVHALHRPLRHIVWVALKPTLLSCNCLQQANLTRSVISEFILVIDRTMLRVYVNKVSVATLECDILAEFAQRLADREICVPSKIA